jgi:WhiB family redox-sensing transcriptional regulator
MSARIGHRTAQAAGVLDELGFTGPDVSSWRGQAACAGTDPELFYPVGTGARVAAQIDRAKQVCAGCPVRETCLADVMASESPGSRWGVIGGRSAAERSAMFAARRDQAAREVA